MNWNFNGGFEIKDFGDDDDDDDGCGDETNDIVESQIRVSLS